MDVQSFPSPRFEWRAQLLFGQLDAFAVREVPGGPARANGRRTATGPRSPRADPREHVDFVQRDVREGADPEDGRIARKPRGIRGLQ